MTEQDELKLARAITALGIAFQKPVSEGLIAAYRMGLDDLPIREIEKAVAVAMREVKFFPTVAELRTFAGQLTPDERAVLAWQFALDNVNYYGTVDFDDKAINATIWAMGGAMGFTERRDAEQLQWLEKEFSRIYKVYLKRGVTPLEALPLGGFHSTNNKDRFPEHVPAITHVGTGLGPVKLIGGNERARVEGQQTVAGLIKSVGRMPE
jgi:hypothetical protein